jgi:hypothetical protein
VYLLNAGLIEAGLRTAGINGANARKLAHVVMDEFHLAGAPPSLSESELSKTVAQIVAAVGVMRNVVRRSFVILPERAPALWGNREDRLPGENPIEFLRRVWGRYLDAGVLYQDQLTHRGETKLVHAIHGHCHRHGLTPKEHLPPPKTARMDRALAEADPLSLEGMFYRARLEERASMRRLRGVPEQRREPR